MATATTAPSPVGTPVPTPTASSRHPTPPSSVTTPPSRDRADSIGSGNGLPPSPPPNSSASSTIGDNLKPSYALTVFLDDVTECLLEPQEDFAVGQPTIVPINTPETRSPSLSPKSSFGPTGDKYSFPTVPDNLEALPPPSRSIASSEDSFDSFDSFSEPRHGDIPITLSDPIAPQYSVARYLAGEMPPTPIIKLEGDSLEANNWAHLIYEDFDAWEKRIGQFANDLHKNNPTRTAEEYSVEIRSVFAQKLLRAPRRNLVGTSDASSPKPSKPGDSANKPPAAAHGPSSLLTRPSTLVRHDSTTVEVGSERGGASSLSPRSAYKVTRFADSDWKSSKESVTEVQQDVKALEARLDKLHNDYGGKLRHYEDLIGTLTRKVDELELELTKVPSASTKDMDKDKGKDKDKDDA